MASNLIMIMNKFDWFHGSVGHAVIVGNCKIPGWAKLYLDNMHTDVLQDTSNTSILKKYGTVSFDVKNTDIPPL